MRAFAALEPRLIVAGQGRAMAGPQRLAALHRLAYGFEAIALPHA